MLDGFYRFYKSESEVDTVFFSYTLRLFISSDTYFVFKLLPLFWQVSKTFFDFIISNHLIYSETYSTRLLLNSRL